MAMTNSPTSPGQPPSGQTVQLHDIHLPEQVSNYPIAPGWWLLLALIVISAVWSYKKFKKSKRLNASKQQALSMLDNNPSINAKECLTLLKWAALQYVNRQQLAKLYGDNFQDFLMKKLPEKHQASFIKLSNAAFKAQYQASTTTVESEVTSEIDSDCLQATKLWLTHALPIIKPLIVDEPLPVNQSLDANKLVSPQQEKELSA
ncbi:DUF4381 domain-containing protein [Colwellia sp. 75C3]|uniref:DUF4381 domain-containing protein n=1 Tax=Colwellia sp. 75C3 TaxID=888425 RepID=UPI000C336A8F|nr:DUF4381 domain-containing protein [Colwellia sp. 75C3]PKG81933.1 DUF4381 domain-containing protein [Colwellia sp. 75C3]